MQSRFPVAKDSRPSPVCKEMVQSQSKNSKEDATIRKSMCRYGPGCTHIMDPSHLEKFWHPRVEKLNDDQIQSHFICNECGYATNCLPDLQLHLQRKTAWSNHSLVGCRIYCLVDLKEWHEGHVTQYHKSGKHLVEFRVPQERRWLVMKKATFYIVERPAVSQDGSEFKDSNENENVLAPAEDSWVFCEDISVNYAFAQSVLFKIYGNNLQETGHLTRGHVCVTESDRIQAQQSRSSLLYGELLPRGANKALGISRLNAANAETLFDLGMGTGKILLQAFLQFRNLRYIYGVELSAARYQLAEDAVLRMVDLLGNENYHVHMSAGKFIMVTEAVKISSSRDENVFNGQEEGEYMGHVLHFQCGNMFDLKKMDMADIVMMETDIPTELYPKLQRMLVQMKDNARILTYFDMRRVFGEGITPFRQMDINKHLSDRYPTSWSVQRGHNFYLWNKTALPEQTTSAPSSWPFSSIISSDVVSAIVASSVSSHPKSSARQGLQEIRSLSVKEEFPSQKNTTVGAIAGCNSSNSSGCSNASQSRHKAAASTTATDRQCLPFRPLRLFFGGSFIRNNTKTNGHPSSSNSSVTSSKGIVANGTAPEGQMSTPGSRQDRSHEVESQKTNSGRDSRNLSIFHLHESHIASSIESASPCRKKIMRYVGEDAHSRDCNIVVPSNISSPVPATESVSVDTVDSVVVTPIPIGQCQADVAPSDFGASIKSIKRQSNSNSGNGGNNNNKLSEFPRIKRPANNSIFDDNSLINDYFSNSKETQDSRGYNTPIKVTGENDTNYGDHQQPFHNSNYDASNPKLVKQGADYNSDFNSKFVNPYEHYDFSQVGSPAVAAASVASSIVSYLGHNSNSYVVGYDKNSSYNQYDDNAHHTGCINHHQSQDNSIYFNNEDATEGHYSSSTVSVAVASTAEFSPDIRACMCASPLLADRELHQPPVAALSPTSATTVGNGTLTQSSTALTYNPPRSLSRHDYHHFAPGEDSSPLHLPNNQGTVVQTNNNYAASTSCATHNDTTAQHITSSKRGLGMKKSPSRSNSPRSTTSPTIAEHSQEISSNYNQVEGAQPETMRLILPGEEASQYLGAVLPVHVSESSEFTRITPRSEKSKKKKGKKNGSGTSVPSLDVSPLAATTVAVVAPPLANHSDPTFLSRDVTDKSSRGFSVNNLTAPLPSSSSSTATNSTTQAEQSVKDRQRNVNQHSSTNVRRNRSTRNNTGAGKNGEVNGASCVIC